jgi:hypothetical protein
MPEQDADVLEVLICKMGKDRNVDAVFRKCVGVLGQAELCEPIGYSCIAANARLNSALWTAGWAILPDRSRREKSTRTVRGRADEAPKSRRPSRWAVRALWPFTPQEGFRRIILSADGGTHGNTARATESEAGSGAPQTAEFHDWGK